MKHEVEVYNVEDYATWVQYCKNMTEATPEHYLNQSYHLIMGYLTKTTRTPSAGATKSERDESFLFLSTRCWTK